MNTGSCYFIMGRVESRVGSGARAARFSNVVVRLCSVDRVKKQTNAESKLIRVVAEAKSSKSTSSD